MPDTFRVYCVFNRQFSDKKCMFLPVFWLAWRLLKLRHAQIIWVKQQRRNMKKLLTAVLALFAVASICVAQDAAGAEGSPLSLDIGADLYSAYIWRGIQVNDEPVIQPAASLSYDLGDFGSISAGAWGNFDLTEGGPNGDPDMSEVDYTISYAVDVSDFSLEAGHIWYTFPNSHGSDGSSTKEVYGAIAYNNDIVTPSAALYYDYDLAEGFFGTLGLGKDFELAENISASLFSTLGAGDDDYNMFYYGTTAAVAALDVGASASYAINDTVSVGVTVVWTSLIDGDIRDNADAAGLDEDMLWGGINLSASF
jgi:uncharacterized protein (TIGR02001 family)